MATRRALTGGTGDVNPQFLSWNIVQTGNDATTTLSVRLPVQRLPSSGKAMVLEVLCVKYDTGTFAAPVNAAQQTYEYVGLTASSIRSSNQPMVINRTASR